MAPLKILICGAGIAGNTLALCLSNQEYDVTVIERSPSLRTTGLQIDLRNRGIEVLKRLGLEQAFRAKSVPEQGLQVVDASGKRRAYFPANRSGKGSQSFTSEFEIMRGDLCQLLYDSSKDRVKYMFGTWIESFEEHGSSVEVRFNNGKIDNYDVLIGADGVHSSVRKMMYASRSAGFHPLDGHFVAYFLLPQPSQDGEQCIATWYTAVGGRLMMTRRNNPDELQVYLGGRSNLERLQNARPGDFEEEKAAVAEMFVGAGGKAEEISRRLVEAKNFYCERLGLVKLDSWSRGRVVLLGDAAYCPTVHTGMGTTCAMVGAYILAGEITRYCGGSKPKNAKIESSISDAFAAYERIFRPFVTKLQDGVSENSGWTVETSFGLAMLHGFLGIASFLKINIFKWMMPEEVKGWILPDYEQLSRKCFAVT